jgi:hypothetical protein
MAALIREALEEKAATLGRRPRSLGMGASGALRHRAACRRGAPRAAVVALILDTGPLYASLDRSDAAHPECRGLIEQAEEALIIPTPVLVEVDYWIHQRLHAAVLVALLTT